MRVALPAREVLVTGCELQQAGEAVRLVFRLADGAVLAMPLSRTDARRLATSILAQTERGELVVVGN